VVAALAGSSSRAACSAPELRSLKGFSAPTSVVSVTKSANERGSMFARTDRHGQIGDRLIRQLDYWETLAGIQRVRAYSGAQLALLPGDVLCGIGCGTGTELLRLHDQVAPGGAVIGVDPSGAMLAECASRARQASVELTLIERDGRDTGLPDASVDAVRMERVIQHTGDIGSFLAEARRILRPGGRISLIDTDWGSLMIEPGAPDLVRRLRSAMESLAEPWSGRKLHRALIAAGFESTSHELFAIRSEPGIHEALRPVLARVLAGGIATDEELREFSTDAAQAMDEGWGAYDFCMYVASGRNPDV
jgi:ubiquinone/menaquinone biosynthesis C-methylase UbiE